MKRALTVLLFLFGCRQETTPRVFIRCDAPSPEQRRAMKMPAPGKKLLLDVTTHVDGTVRVIGKMRVEDREVCVRADVPSGATQAQVDAALLDVDAETLRRAADAVSRVTTSTGG